MKYILAIDQGTSSTKTILFDEQGQAFARGLEPLRTIFPGNGFVEQNPEEIYQNVLLSVEKCLADFQSKSGGIKSIAAIGISNQRETFVIWDENGVPLYNAVVWQCKRSVDTCKRWKEAGYEPMIKTHTGLLADPYFSGSKLVWLYENEPAIKAAIDSGKAWFGTIDTWLLYRLTEGKSYLTDYTNASRTLFFNLHTLRWDKELLALFDLSHLNLPGCKASSAFYGETTCNGLLPFPVAITGVIGDSHAAAFGEGCFTTGTAKATLGTGCSILMNTGDTPKPSQNGMVTTICWSTEETVQYALEGVIVTCGATIEWLKNSLGLINDSKETDSLAHSVPDNGGVYLVPAFSGLGAPYWDMERKAEITGLTFDSTKAHIVRAALESIPFQIKDVIEAMEEDASIRLQQLMVNGGITANAFVMQFLTDLLNKPVASVGQPDISALGAAFMAGLKAGIFPSLNHLAQLNQNKKMVRPAENNQTQVYYDQWKKAVAKPGNTG